MSYNIYNKATDSLEQIAGGADNRQIASISAKVDEVRADVPFKFGIDENGNYGYVKEGADSVTPFLNLKAMYIGAIYGTDANPNISRIYENPDGSVTGVSGAGGNLTSTITFNKTMNIDVVGEFIGRGNVNTRVVTVKRGTETLYQLQGLKSTPSINLFPMVINEGDVLTITATKDSANISSATLLFFEGQATQLKQK